MSELQSSTAMRVHDVDASQSQAAPPGVLRSLAFWFCLLLAAGGYAAVTLAPSYLRNQQLKVESAAADAELRRLVAQVDRYERYCSRLTDEQGGADRRDEGVAAAPSHRPSPPHWANTSPRAERGREGEPGLAAEASGVPSQQMAIDESLQFQLEDVAAADGQATAPPRVPTVIALFGRSRAVRGVVRLLSAVLLLLAFTLCLDSPQERPPAVRPRRTARQLRHPLAWLGMRYRSAGSSGPN